MATLKHASPREQQQHGSEINLGVCGFYSVFTIFTTMFAILMCKHTGSSGVYFHAEKHVWNKPNPCVSTVHYVIICSEAWVTMRSPSVCPPHPALRLAGKHFSVNRKPEQIIFICKIGVHDRNGIYTVKINHTMTQTHKHGLYSHTHVRYSTAVVLYVTVTLCVAVVWSRQRCEGHSLQHSNQQHCASGRSLYWRHVLLWSTVASGKYSETLYPGFILSKNNKT